jgi:muramoyltetrapeptide carboxypeptidase
VDEAMTNKAWNFLKPGDIIDIIAPSSAAPVEDLAQYYARAKDAFAKIGLIARISDDLITIGEDPFSANSLEYRVNSIIDAFSNSDSKAIWAIRGGYGAAKLIPFLEKIDPPKTSKLLLGFSDVTALHLFLENKWKRCSMHSAVINQIIMNPNFLEELRPILFGDVEKITYNQLVPLNSSAKINQHIKASITGGNLSIVQTSLATSWQINAKDKIIFLEDVGEQGYRIDRMLNQLLQAGVFDNAKAVIFGEITPPIGIEPDLCGVAIENFAKTLDIPVLSLPIIGHSIKHNSPLPLGSECELILGDGAAELACDSGGH